MNALPPPDRRRPDRARRAAPDAAESPLEGFRIGVTSHRRSRDLIEALERRGAEVLHAPALKIAPVQEDMRLIEDTRAIIAAKPDLCIATTAYGMRRWCEAADTFGHRRGAAGNPGRHAGCSSAGPRPAVPSARPGSPTSGSAATKPPPRWWTCCWPKACAARPWRCSCTATRTSASSSGCGCPAPPS